MLPPLLNFARAQQSSHVLLITAVSALLTFLVWTLLNFWLIATRGQTIGKVIAKTRIVTMDGRRASFSRIVFAREGFPCLLLAIPYAGPFLWLAEIIFLFQEDRRCLHDWVAGTKVVTLAPPPLAFKPEQKVEIVRKPAPFIAAAIRRQLDLDPSEVPLNASWRNDLRIPGGVLSDFLEPLADAFPAIDRREIERSKSLGELLAIFEISPDQFEKAALLKAGRKSPDS